MFILITIMIGIMMPMTIRVMRVQAVDSMIMPVHMRRWPAGTGISVHATVHVHVPGLRGRATIRMAFQAPAGSNREDWAEITYERALMMLDPA